MSVVLRVWGRNLDIESAIDTISLGPCSIARCGERKSPSSTSNFDVFDMSGVGFCVSDAGFSEFSLQVEQTIDFLDQHFDEIKLLLSVSGVDQAALCFGVTRRDVVVEVTRFPSRLINLAGQLGLGVELSQYPSESH